MNKIKHTTYKRIKLPNVIAPQEIMVLFLIFEELIDFFRRNQGQIIIYLMHDIDVRFSEGCSVLRNIKRIIFNKPKKRMLRKQNHENYSR